LSGRRRRSIKTGPRPRASPAGDLRRRVVQTHRRSAARPGSGCHLPHALPLPDRRRDARQTAQLGAAHARRDWNRPGARLVDPGRRSRRARLSDQRGQSRVRPLQIGARRDAGAGAAPVVARRRQSAPGGAGRGPGSCARRAPGSDRAADGSRGGGRPRRRPRLFCNCRQPGRHGRHPSAGRPRHRRGGPAARDPNCAGRT